MSRERILCAAVWVDDGKEYAHQPTPTGLVFCALRHSAAIELAYYAGLGDEEARAGRHQGFLTSRGRYVDRGEAFQIAKEAGQLPVNLSHSRAWLSSEDLY